MDLPLPASSTKRRLASLLSALLLVGASGSTFAAEPTDAQKQEAGKFYMEGERLFNDGLYSAAIENYKKAHGIFPATQAIYNIALSYEKLGDGLNCVKWYDEYVTYYRSTNDNTDPSDVVDVRGRVQKCQLLIRPEITVTSNPEGAKFYIDDKAKLLGQTPYSTKLDPGSYTIYLEQDGFQPFKETIEVRAGEPIKLFFKLEKLQRVGAVTINSNIRGASIFIDGKSVGLTPFSEKLVLDEGLHQITVDKDEYKAYSREVTIVVNEDYAIDSELYLLDSPTTWKGPVGIVSIVLGAGGIVGGVLLGNEADNHFKGTEDFDKWAGLQKVSYGVGAGLIGVGVLLVILESADNQHIKADDEIDDDAAFVPVDITPIAGAIRGGGMVGADVRF